MKILMSWLNEFVDISEYQSEPEKLAEKLTAAGLEVESVEKLGSIDHLVIGKIIELKKHPDADKLTVCKVDVGADTPSQIVCGAKNHKEGDLVCAALPGCVLPGDFKIKKSKIRGVESLGMLCSDKEMALSNESEGIKILDQDAPIGESVTKYLNLDEVIFEISVTPNRADCLSHWGLAREISCLIDKPLKFSDPQVESGKTTISNRFKISVKNDELCPRFMGRWIENVKVRPSPKWLVNKLERAGFNSINNIVDITNYVMLELGQPMHAYDYDFIEGAEITVSDSKPGEKFISFDGSEYFLTGEELTIRDKNKVLGLAGVVGSKNSGVSEKTQNVFLECAYFIPSSVRKTSRRFGIETDAAYRFSRGTDIEMIPRSINLACQMMMDLADGVVAKDIYDFYPQPLTKSKIKITIQDISDRLGFKATEKQFEYWLERLSCEFTKSQEGYTVFPPAFRYDMSIKEDLIEEYGRLEGYDQIPEVLPEMISEPTAHDFSFVKAKAVTQLMLEQGFTQAINYNFDSSLRYEQLAINVKNMNQYSIGHEGGVVKIKNPLSDKMNIMRSLMFPQLFENAIHNFKHGQTNGKLFECGSVFYKKEKGYAEELRLGGLIWGKLENYWEHSNSGAYSVFKIKSYLEALLSKLNISGYRFDQDVTLKEPEFLHPGQWAALFVKGKYVGVIGSVHPKLMEDEKFREPMSYFELNVDLITKDLTSYSKVKGLVYYPTVKRDLTFELDNKILFKDIHRVVNKVSGSLFQKLDLKDIFKSDKLGPNKMALTVTLYLQDQKGPIEDKALDQIQDKIFKTIATEFK